MGSLERQLSSYAAYHQDARNRATHFLGVPMIMLALFVALSWPRFPAAGVELSAARLLAGAVLAYYFLLDKALALAMLAFVAALVLLGEAIASRGAAFTRPCFGALFAGGWLLQLLGHALFEGRKPALADNLLQIFVAPLFLCAELFFALGYKPALRAAVRKHALELRARSPRSPRCSASSARSSASSSSNC